MNRIVQRVAIFGYAGAEAHEELYREAYQVSKVLAEHHYAIVNGGGPGVMVAATNGAEAAQGETLTVTLQPRFAPNFEKRYLKNHPDVEIRTSNYIERMFTLMVESDFFVIFNGGTGTLSEFATAWLLAWLYKGEHKGFVLYGEFWKEIIAVMKKHMRIQDGSEELFEIVTTPEEVLAAIDRYEQQMTKRKHDNEHAGEEGAFMVGGGKRITVN